MGDVTHIYTTDGTLVARYAYDAWGNHKIYDVNGGEVTKSMSDHIGNINPIRYRGYYYDTETELYYLEARYYDPDTGRFISQDEIDFILPNHLTGLNLYAYCSNNPIMYTDPSGNFFLTALIVGAIAGAVIGATVGGVVAYNSAKSSGLTGMDLFTETLSGIGKGALIGGIAGGLIGATGGAIATYGVGSVAATAMITGTATIMAKATEVASLQSRSSIMAGKNGWQIANDSIDSIFSNGMNIIFPALSKAGTTGLSYVYSDFTKYKVLPITPNKFFKSKSVGGRILSYGMAAYAWIETIYSMICNDPISRADSRGYTLK